MMQYGRGILELIFIILIIGLIAGIFSGYLIKNLDEAREVALENQLTNLKYSLELYMVLEGSYPEDIRELNKKYRTVKESTLYGKRYLEGEAQDKEGYPIDPYGHRFIYNSKTGKIEGGTKQ